MALQYNAFPDGARLETVRNELNRFNNDVTNQFNNLLIEFDQVQTNVAQNSADISDHETRITQLETVQAYYEYNKVQNVNVPDANYTQVNRLTRVNVPVGLYELKIAFAYNYSNNSTSVFYRVSLDGGQTWKEYSKEPKDTTDTELVYYGFPQEITTGDIDFILEIRQETSGHTLTILDCDLIIDKK